MNEAQLLKDLLEEAFYITTRGELQFKYIEDTPIDGELGDSLKAYIRQRSLDCPDYDENK